MCVPFLSRCHLSVPELRKYGSEGQGRGLCDKYFGGVPSGGAQPGNVIEVGDVLLRSRTVDEAPGPFCLAEREARRDSGWGQVLPSWEAENPRGLRTGLGGLPRRSVPRAAFRS